MDNFKNKDHVNESGDPKEKNISDMVFDLKMLNQRIQGADGIAGLSEADFKSEHGKKRYNELKSIADGKNVTYNKDELQTIGNELEGLVKKAESSKEDDNKKKDLELINKRIQSSGGIAGMSEADFKSAYAKKRYKELMVVIVSKHTTFNKEELEILGKELEGSLSGKESKKDEDALVVVEDKNTKTDKDNDAALSADKAREDAKNRALEKVKQKVAVVNIDELAEAEARKAADAYMTESKASLKGAKGFLKKIWKHTFFDEYYRQREVNRVRDEIKNSGNIYAGRIKDGNKDAHENAMHGISERFASEYEGTLSKGEEKKALDNQDPESVKATADVKSLINEYAKGTLGKEAFENEKTRILNTLKDKDILKGSGVFADNLFEIAQNARLAIEHGAKLEELDLDTNIIIGKAKSSLKTEAHFNAVDKVIDKMKKSKIGRFISPAVLSTSVGIAYSLSVGLGKRATNSKLAAAFTFGAAVAASSAFAGMNESQRLAAERAQHGIEMAEGASFEEGSKRREQMEKFGYQMEDATALTQKLHNLMFEKDQNGKDVPRDVKPEELDAIFASLAEIEARNGINAKNKIDLISYSNIGNVEKERTDLTILTARAKVELRKKMEAGLTNGSIQGKTFDQYLSEQTKIFEDSLLGGEKGINAQDKSFSKFKTKEVAKKVLATIVVGLTVGATIQEGVAFFKDDVQGFVEELVKGDGGNFTTQTPLENAFSFIAGHATHMGMKDAVDININGHDFMMPEGTSIVQNPDGTFNILRGDAIISDHTPLTFDSSGSLDADSVARLGEDGIVANTTCNALETTQAVAKTAGEYAHDHAGSTTHIARDGWYDNDTPKPIFDQNELKLQMGGVNGTGIDANGNYVLDMDQMASGGSFHEQFSVDAQEKMKSGLLKMAFSLTQDTQHNVFEVPIDVNGNAVIDPNSEIGKLFFGTENGHAVFKGRFAEVIESFGSHDGAEHVKSLATLVGPGNNSIIDDIVVPIEIPVTNIDVPVGTEPPYFIPVGARKPLEPVKYNENLYYGGTMDIESWKKDFSPRLKNNPDVKLDSQEEIAWYFKDQKRRYPGYVEKELAGLDAQNPLPLGKKVEAIVCVAAAGHQEHNNIYKSLETYATQKDKKGESVWKGIDENKFEIFLYINWPKGQNPQKTLDEIERFKKDHPQVRLRVYKEEIEGGKVELGWLKKKIFDLALKKHGDRNSKNDIAIITNDADMTFVAPHYLENAIGSLNSKKNQNVDAILGRHDLDPGIYKKNPTFHTAMRFWQMMEAVMRSKYGLIGSQGRNTIMRGSSYAAVGGNHTKEFWGDIEFGSKFGIARGRSAMAHSNDAWVTVDPRREIDKFKSGEKIAHTWNSDFDTRDVRGSAKSEHAVPENLDISRLAGLEENDPEVVAFKLRLQDELQEICNLFDRITPGYISMPNNPGLEKEIKPEVKMLAERALGFLGIKADIMDYEEDGHMKFKLNLTDTKKLREGLKSYNENDGDKVKMPK